MAFLFIILCLLGGAALALQASVNGEVGMRIGTIEASAIAYGVGTIALICFAFFLGRGDVSNVQELSKWKLLIGVCGAFYIFTVVLAVPKIGVSTAVIAGIAGQILISMIIDHFGLFGTKQLPINLTRISAFMLLLSSLYLFYKA